MCDRQRIYIYIYIYIYIAWESSYLGELNGKTKMKGQWSSSTIHWLYVLMVVGWEKFVR
jgi:hypothetical protein